MILFTDNDGVLNAHEFNEQSQSFSLRPDCVARFNKIIEAANPKVVLSTAWRYMILGNAMTLKGFEYLWRTHGITARINLIGTCGFDIDEDYCNRGKTIEEFIKGFSITEDFLILDDCPKGMSFAPYEDKVYKTNGSLGLTDRDVDDIIRLLKQV